jgi:predicted RNA-binding protein with PIN domain
MKLLIDGYNVIPAIPELGRALRADLEAGREAFLNLLGEYRRTSKEKLDIAVIFDGQRGMGGEGEDRSGNKRVHGIGVRFSRGEIADDLIVRLRKDEFRGATLVTSDRELRDRAEPTAGALVRSGEFADRLIMTMAAEGSIEIEERPKRTTTKKKGNPRKLSKKEREYRRSLDKL